MPGTGLRTIEPKSIAGWLTSRRKGLLLKIVSRYRIYSRQEASASREGNSGEI